jgi:hypothetical protein
LRELVSRRPTRRFTPAASCFGGYKSPLASVQGLGLDGVFKRGKGRKYLIADSAFRRMQVDAPGACRGAPAAPTQLDRTVGFTLAALIGNGAAWSVATLPAIKVNSPPFWRAMDVGAIKAPTKQHSSGGKDRLGSISKQGDRYLCSLFGRSSRCTELMPLAGGHPPPDEASLRRTFRKFYSASTKSAYDAEADIACTTFRTASTASQRARSLEGSTCLRRKDRLTRSEALHNGRRRQAGC